MGARGPGGGGRGRGAAAGAVTSREGVGAAREPADDKPTRGAAAGVAGRRLSAVSCARACSFALLLLLPGRPRPRPLRNFPRKLRNSAPERPGCALCSPRGRGPPGLSGRRTCLGRRRRPGPGSGQTQAAAVAAAAVAAAGSLRPPAPSPGYRSPPPPTCALVPRSASSVPAAYFGFLPLISLSFYFLHMGKS